MTNRDVVRDDANEPLHLRDGFGVVEASPSTRRATSQRSVDQGAPFGMPFPLVAAPSCFEQGALVEMV